VIALIVVILIQRSEGGALGIGGGGGGGGLMTARGSANLLTRTSAILATLFFISAIGLTILSELDRGTSSILDSAATTEEGEQPTTVLDALNALQGDETSDLLIPGEVTDPADAAPAADPAAPASTESDLPVPAAPAETTTTEPAASTPAAPENAVAPAAAPDETPAAPAGN
jgi:preprotein translocase subunit SecG